MLRCYHLLGDRELSIYLAIFIVENEAYRDMPRGERQMFVCREYGNGMDYDEGMTDEEFTWRLTDEFYSRGEEGLSVLLYDVERGLKEPELKPGAVTGAEPLETEAEYREHAAVSESPMLSEEGRERL